MPREVERERAGRRAGRRILGDAAAGTNIRVFQRRARAGDAVDAEHLRRARRARARSGFSAATSACEPSVDEHVLQPVVVHLDRQLRPLDAERVEELAPRPRTAAIVGIGCSIRPKTIRAPSRSSRTGTTPLPVSSRISPSWSGAGEHERRAERRMPGERHLDPRREDPDPRVGALAFGG